MGSSVRIGPLSSLQGDSGSNISDPVYSEDDSDKVHKDSVNQNEISNDGRENHSVNALLGPQELVTAELSFSEGIYLFCIVLKILCLLLTEWADI